MQPAIVLVNLLPHQEAPLFLDEIGEMSDAFQAKILRVLEEKKITPLGSEKSMLSDVRIIAATNKNLLERISEKKFREDLYYRLCGIEITIPPLRERLEDLHLLALHCLNKAHAQQKPANRTEHPPHLSQVTLELLRCFSWPGNIRQLEQALFAAFVLCDGYEITPVDLPDWLHRAMEQTKVTTMLPAKHPSDSPTQGQEHIQSLAEDEMARFISALNATKYRGTGRWNISAAARELGIPRETLTYRLKKITQSYRIGIGTSHKEVTVKCTKCLADNQDTAKYCSECGSKLSDLDNMPSMNVTKLQAYTPRYLAEKILLSRSALEGERKQVTVLFADMKRIHGNACRSGSGGGHAKFLIRC